MHILRNIFMVIFLLLVSKSVYAKTIQIDFTPYDSFSIEEFEQYEDLNSFLVSSEFVDEHTVEHHMDEMEYYTGHKVINDRGIISEKE